MAYSCIISGWGYKRFTGREIVYSAYTGTCVIISLAQNNRDKYRQNLHTSQFAFPLSVNIHHLFICLFIYLIIYLFVYLFIN
jgi:hypothetical protein